MENPEIGENVSNQTAEATVKRKKKMKRQCPVCSKRLYQDSSERWYCPHCLAEVEGDRISFNYVPEGELYTLLQTG